MSAVKRSGEGGWISRIATVILLPTLSIGVVVALFEVGLRIAGHQAIYEIYSKPSIFWKHDERLGWSHQESTSGEYVGPRPWPIEFRGSVSINSLGLRGPEVPPARPDELRVFVAGDSMVASFEVDYEQAFGSILERELRRRLGREVHVINGGVRGYGSDQSYLLFREHADVLAPDLVVLFHSGNDPADNTTLHEMRRPFGKPAFVLADDGSLELVGSPTPVYPKCSEVRLSEDSLVVRVDTTFARMMCRTQMALLDHSALFSLLTITIPWDGTLLTKLYRLGNPRAAPLASAASSGHGFAERLTTTIVLELAREVQMRGAEFLVIGFPAHLEQLDAARLAEQSIQMVGLDEIANAPQEEVRWRHDSHLNPVGHQRLADKLLLHVEPRLRARLAASR